MNKILVKIIKSDKLPPISALIIVSLIYYRWFLPDSFANGDIPLISLVNIKDLYAPFFWKGFHDTGIPYVESPFLVINYLASFISLTFQKTFNSFSIKILFFYPFILFSSLGTYHLTYKITKDKTSSFIASLLYSLNTPIIMFLSQGFTNIVVPVSLFPLIFLFSIKYLEEKGIKNFLILLLIFITESFYEFRIFYLSFICFSLFVFFNLIINRFKDVKKIILVMFGILFFSISANLYWILPNFLSTLSIASNPLLNRSILVVENMSILNPVLLFHPYWTGNQIAIFSSQSIPLIFFATGIFLITGLLLGRRDKHIVFFGLLLILGISLTKGISYPFPHFFLLFYNLVPGFKVFREFHKFFFLISLPFSILLGYYFKSILQANKKIVILFSLFLIFIYIFSIAKPIFNGSIGTIFIPIKNSINEYSKVDDYLTTKNKNEFFRVIWIPRNSSNGILSYSMPNVNLVSMEPLWRTILKTDWKGQTLSSVFSAKNAESLFRNENIRYVVLASSSNLIDGNLFYWYEQRDIYEKKLDSMPYLTKINLNDKRVSLYEIKGYKPHLFLTSSLPSFRKNYEYKNVKYKQINPTQYQITIKELKNKSYLNFTDDYSPDWKITYQNYSVLKSVLSRKYFFPDKFHLITDFHSNSYILDPKYIKSLNTGNYKINKNGSLDVTLTLIYRPQSLFYMGIILSVSIFALSILGLIIYEKRKS